jgi:hypothetical protein
VRRDLEVMERLERLVGAAPTPDRRVLDADHDVEDDGP